MAKFIARALHKHHFQGLRSEDRAALGASQLQQVAMVTLVAAVLPGEAWSAPNTADLNFTVLASMMRCCPWQGRGDPAWAAKGSCHVTRKARRRNPPTHWHGVQWGEHAQPPCMVAGRTPGGGMWAGAILTTHVHACACLLALRACQLTAATRCTRTHHDAILLTDDELNEARAAAGGAMDRFEIAWPHGAGWLDACLHRADSHGRTHEMHVRNLITASGPQ